MARRRSGRASALRRRRLPRVPRRRAGQPDGPADGLRPQPGEPGPQAGQAERRRACGAPRRGGSGAHRRVRGRRAGLRRPCPGRLGSAAPPVRRHRGDRRRHGGRRLRRVAPARLGSGRLAGQGLPAGQPGTARRGLAGGHAAAAAGDPRARGIVRCHRSGHSGRGPRGQRSPPRGRRPRGCLAGAAARLRPPPALIRSRAYRLPRPPALSAPAASCAGPAPARLLRRPPLGPVRPGRQPYHPPFRPPPAPTIRAGVCDGCANHHNLL